MRACEGESECEGEGIGEGVLYILIWRGARASARWRGRRRGSVHGRGALLARDELRASTQRNCMQARSARERRGGGMPSAREGKQADANDRRASGSSIETRKPATRRTFSETSKQRGHVHALLIFLLSTRVHEDCQSTPLSISGGKYQLRRRGPARGGPGCEVFCRLVSHSLADAAELRPCHPRPGSPVVLRWSLMSATGETKSGV